MFLNKPESALGLCGLLLVGLTGVTVAMPGPVSPHWGIIHDVRIDYFVALAGAQAVIYLAAVAVVLRAGSTAGMFWMVIGGAVMLRLIALSVPPFLSNDIYRYIWDGWVQAAGINPYRYIPVDPHLAFLRDDVVYPNINRADYAHTIYPPAAEMVFFIATRIGGFLHLPPVLAMRCCIVVLEGVGIWAMARLLGLAGQPPMRVLIYAWNPLPVWEFAGNGHVDAIAVCFVSLALLAACGRKTGWSAAALAAATLTKFLPVILLPALWRRWDWRFAGVFIALIIALYLPYLGVGRQVLGFLPSYGAEEGIGSGQGIFFLAAFSQAAALTGVAAKIYLGSVALLLIGLGLGMVFGQKLPAAREDATRLICQRVLVLGGLFMAALSPHYPWYYCWLLIPACVMPWPSILYLATASFVLYLNPTHTQLFWPGFLYVPFVLLALRDTLAGNASITTSSPRLVKGDRI